MEYKITKEQILELNNTSSGKTKNLLKTWFPEIFETQFENGKWYKYRGSDNGYPLVCYQGETSGFGFNGQGGWSELSSGWSFKTRPNDWVKADNEDIYVTLNNYYGRHYKKEGFKCLNTNEIFNKLIIFEKEYSALDDKFSIDGYIVYQKGKWAEKILPVMELTIDDIAERFGVSANQIKIKK